MKIANVLISQNKILQYRVNLVFLSNVLEGTI